MTKKRNQRTGVKVPLLAAEARAGITLRVTHQEYDTMLAALRFWQCERDGVNEDTGKPIAADYAEIADAHGKPLDDKQIDQFIERVQFDDPQSTPKRARTNKLAESLLEQDEDLGAALDAALDAAEQVLQKQVPGTIWAGKYEPMQLTALFQQHIETHLCEELIAIAEHGDYTHWREAGKPDPSFDQEPENQEKPLRRRYFAMVPSWSETKARTIDVIGGTEKDSAGMDAALKAAHKALGKSVNVKLIPVSDTKPNMTVKLANG